MSGKQVLCLLMTAVIILTAASCTSRYLPITQESGDLAGAPIWVTRGSPSLYKGDDLLTLYGVGSSGPHAPGKKSKPHAQNGKVQAADRGLDRSDAVLQAKKQITSALSIIVMDILRDYGAKGGDAGLRSLAGDAKGMEELSRQLTAKVVAEAPVMDSWVSPDGSVYALVKCDSDAFIYRVSSMQDLTEATRKGIMERADKAFEHFDPKTALKAVTH